MEAEPIEVNHEKRFQRFLYTGRDTPKYIAGGYKTNTFEQTDVFTNIAIDFPKACDAVKKFELAKKNSSYSAPIIYALAATIQALSKDDKHYEIREAFYQTVPNILENTEELMLFVKYTTNLGLKKGTRWQNCIKAWYMKCTYDLLVKDIALVKSKYGWTHKDLLRLLHLAPSCGKEPSVALKFIWSGLGSLSDLTYVPPNIVEELQNIEKLRKCRDFTEAASLIRKINGLKYSHVPKHLVHSHKDNTEVWKALIDQLSLSDLLVNIEYLQSAGVLEEQKPTDGKKEISRPQLTSHLIAAIAKATVPPALAYIVYCNYKNNRGFLKVADKSVKIKTLEGKALEDALKKNDECVKGYISKSKKRKLKFQNRCLPASDLVNALKHLVDRSLLTTEVSINMNCMITLDMRELMFKSLKQQKNKTLQQKTEIETNCEEEPETPILQSDLSENRKPAKCYYNKRVVPGHAGILLALYLTKCMEQTTVAVYTNDGIKCVKLYKNVNNVKQVLTMSEAEAVIKNVNAGKVSFNKPFDWAMSNKKSIELFVNVVDTAARINQNSKMRQTSKNISAALSEYRMAMNLPKARVMTISLSTHKVVSADDSVDGVFDVAGFDENIPELIKSFAVGEFD
ncbi:RNA-binding protein Ro60-like [Arctopsyche grandis]|uniref:RNA-binding protein Ro60-like n=1 Tax=Arctopsyche grandis TaxID=121162 RepID=UPI00406D9037